MKKFKKSVIMLLSLAFILSVCVSVVTACNPSEQKTQYSVSIGDFDQSKGNITVNEEKVDAGKEVTVTVTSKEGYEIKDFYIGSNNLTQDFYSRNNMATSKDYTSGEYTFKVNKDSVIRAEFQLKGTNGKDDYVYTLTCEYDSIKGGVAVNPDRARFADGETVTLNIVLNSNYLLESIFVNNTDRVSEAKQAGNNYTYNFAFDITEDSTVRIVINYDFTIIDDIEVNKFDAAINSSEWVLCDFWASNCGPCVNYLGPSIKRLAKGKKLGNVRVIKVELLSYSDNTSPAAQLKNSVAKKLGQNMPGLPFVVLFHNGKETACFTGAYADQTAQDNSVIEFIQKNVK